MAYASIIRTSRTGIGTLVSEVVTKAIGNILVASNSFLFGTEEQKEDALNMLMVKGHVVVYFLGFNIPNINDIGINVEKEYIAYYNNKTGRMLLAVDREKGEIDYLVY